MPPVLRPAEPADAEAIAALLAQEIAQGFAHFGTEPPRPAELSGEIAAAAALPCHVAVVEDEVVGFARVTPWKARGGYAWTGEVGV
jgi:L-amino acid N-acyltransferase YncA